MLLLMLALFISGGGERPKVVECSRAEGRGGPWLVLADKEGKCPSGTKGVVGGGGKVAGQGCGKEVKSGRRGVECREVELMGARANK